MRIGKLSDRITFQRATETNVSGVVSTDEWKDFASCWAWVMSKSGSSTDQADQLTYTHLYTIATRRRTDIKETDRILYMGKILYIDSISFDGPVEDQTQFLCRERREQ